jgi:hypothetical protein
VCVSLESVVDTEMYLQDGPMVQLSTCRNMVDPDFHDVPITYLPKYGDTDLMYVSSIYESLSTYRISTQLTSPLPVTD